LVSDGHSSVNEAMLTDESKSVLKKFYFIFEFLNLRFNSLIKSTRYLISSLWNVFPQGGHRLDLPTAVEPPEIAKINSSSFLFSINFLVVKSGG
jgi:hypothetical protein